ncbi:MAG: adenylate/guanylate cyclase domain-containing protein [Magnetococcales bacterium]|nr:adenylate/guanylate cyclase domain-containing protein [Magnetococcales bacterium]
MAEKRDHSMLGNHEQRFVKVIGFMLCFLLTVGLFLQKPWFVRELDRQLLDHHFTQLRQNNRHASVEEKIILPPRSNPIVIGVDTKTEDLFNDIPVALWHPFWGRFFQAMAMANPSVIGVDYIFPAKTYDTLFHDFLTGYLPRLAEFFEINKLETIDFSEVTPDYDTPLLHGLLSLGVPRIPLALGQLWDKEGSEYQIDRSIMGLLFSLPGGGDVGYLYVPQDEDKTARRYLTSVSGPQGTRPSLSALMARFSATKSDQALAIEGWIDYSIGEPFTYIPFWQVLEWQQTGDVAALKSAFEGHPVILGDVAGYEDMHSVPVLDLVSQFKGQKIIPGVFIHAQALRTLLHRGLIVEQSAFSFFNVDIPFFVIAVLIPLIFLLGHFVAIGMGLVLLILFGGYFISSSAIQSGIFLPVSILMVNALIALFLGVLTETIIGLLEKRRLKSSFGGSVSPQVMEAISAGTIHPSLKGEVRQVCVLFSDIRNFTTRCEDLQPETVISFLNRYFEAMSSAIHHHNGTLDKFIGDGILAFFGAPGSSSTTPSNDAFLASQEMLTRLKVLNESFAQEGIQPIEIGIGLHFGSVVVGYVGSSSRFEYTVIGDTVNAASRVESLTKNLGYSLLVSEDARKNLEDATILEKLIDLGYNEVKGRHPIRVFGLQPQ